MAGLFMRLHLVPWGYYSFHHSNQDSGETVRILRFLLMSYVVVPSLVAMLHLMLDVHERG